MTWEARMAERAAERAAVVEAAERIAREVETPGDKRHRAMIEETNRMRGQERWVLRPFYWPRPAPLVGDPDPESPITVDNPWPDPGACKKCHVHNDKGEQLQRVAVHPWGDRWWWVAVQSCDSDWIYHSERHYDRERGPWEHVGCDCWCHQVEGPPVLIA